MKKLNPKSGSFEKSTKVKTGRNTAVCIDKLEKGDKVLCSDGTFCVIDNTFSGCDLHYSIHLENGDNFCVNSRKDICLKRSIPDRYYRHLPEICHVNIVDLQRKLNSGKPFCKIFKIPTLNGNAKINRIIAVGIKQYFGIELEDETKIFLLENGVFSC